MFIFIFVIIIISSPVIHCAGLEDSNNLAEVTSSKEHYQFSASKGAVDNGLQAGKEVLKVVLSEGLTSYGAATAAGTAAGAAIKATAGMPPFQRAALVGGTTFMTAATTSLGLRVGKHLGRNLDLDTNLKISKNNNNPDIDSVPSPTDNIINSPLEIGDISPLEELLTDMFKINILLSFLFLMFVFLIFYRYLYTVNSKFLAKLFNRFIPDSFKSSFNFGSKLSSDFNDKFILFLFIVNIFNLILLLTVNLYVSFELSTNIKDYVDIYNYIHGISKF